MSNNSTKQQRKQLQYISNNILENRPDIISFAVSVARFLLLGCLLASHKRTPIHNSSILQLYRMFDLNKFNRIKSQNNALINSCFVELFVTPKLSHSISLIVAIDKRRPIPCIKSVCVCVLCNFYSLWSSSFVIHYNWNSVKNSKEIGSVFNFHWVLYSFCIIRIDLTMDKYHYYIDCGMEMKEEICFFLANCGRRCFVFCFLTK